MNFYMLNPTLDEQITDIRTKIRLSMNGIVSEQMEQKGIVYKRNYGVSIPRIKELAAAYSPNHDLAQRLWALKYRETMIMATLLEPADRLTEQQANEWVTQLNQTELVEQACMNLFSKASFAPELCLNWIQSEETWTRVAGFTLCARIGNRLSSAQFHQVVQVALQHIDTELYPQYKSIALCLSRLCRRGKDESTDILKQLKEVSLTGSIAHQYILNEVSQEILFLDFL